MKIYFGGSIRGGRSDVELYAGIVDKLTKFGTVLTEYVGDKNLSSYGEMTMTDEQIYTRDVDWLSQSDVVVAEVTVPSLGVGYEIAKAESMGKKILCLYREQPGKKLSAMIAGSTRLKICYYKNIQDLDLVLENFFNN